MKTCIVCKESITEGDRAYHPWCFGPPCLMPALDEAIETLRTRDQPKPKRKPMTVETYRAVIHIIYANSARS